ncbi:hypothetical protein [Pseudomonas sp. GL-B-16]|uniref:hypothetical protein n=1 Tax=Pseudomonas sp. GL-B-16 TaxID=2832373 RepID=UPI001CBD6E6C|nr:hypothetical protein [Pseudomonas sp. GL-B-16]
MTDYTELKRLAEAAMPSEDSPHLPCTVAFDRAASPAAVLALIAELENFNSEVSKWTEREVLLIAENERLKGLQPSLPPRPPEGYGLPRFGLRWNGPSNPLAVSMEDGYWTPWHLASQLKAENEAMRKALTECAASLEGEMLQKYHGQKPEDMHPVTRRDHDRDMAELDGYRAAMSKGEQA